MKVLVTGSRGYIGTVLMGMLADRGHEAVGFDAGWYEGADFGLVPDIELISGDIRTIPVETLQGFDAVLHFAAICNDPIGDLDSSVTYSINRDASVALAEKAKSAGVGRFVFSSSCSLYGAGAPGELLDESAAFNPVTPYGTSKVEAEQGINGLAGGGFSVTHLRNATAFGLSPRLRCDVVVNNLAGHAVGKGAVLVKSDGTPWRPLVHVEDISAAAIQLMEADGSLVDRRAFNIVPEGENHQVGAVAEMVAEAAGVTVRFEPGGEPDIRDYQVDGSAFLETFPEFSYQWTVPLGIEQIVSGFQDFNITIHDVEETFKRLTWIDRHRGNGSMDDMLRWV
ncbi:MAG: NAD-dependent epimerase/dehydratase family protein [Acidimicrobiia bacterium]|nr:NAD-dependent epimerase/dehydratase family protein [Acidimicrobiia bacterium]